MTYAFPPSDNFPDGTQEEAAFDASAQELITFLESMPGFATWVDARQAEVNATALSGDLPSLTGQASKVLGVVGAGDAVAFAAVVLGGTVGGTADALTLTTGLTLTAITSGQRFWMVPTANNTGAATLDVDGIGAQTLKTIDGSDLPADYLRASIPTEFYWDGTNYVADRQDEVIGAANATNGEVIRHANGMQRARKIQGSITGADTSWTFASAFVSASTEATGHVTHNGTGGAVMGRTSTPSNTSVDFSAYNTSGARVAVTCSVTVEGRWY